MELPRLKHSVYRGKRENRIKDDKEVQCRIHEAWGWCTGRTQRDGMGREGGRGFRMGNMCTPMADAC